MALRSKRRGEPRVNSSGHATPETWSVSTCGVWVGRQHLGASACALRWLLPDACAACGLACRVHEQPLGRRRPLASAHYAAEMAIAV